MMPKYVMLDLETLSLYPSAVILSIGAVAYDDDHLGLEFYTAISLTDQYALGRTESESTHRWWSEQGDEAKKVFADAATAPPLKEALEGLSKFIKDLQYDVSIWAKGAAFDLAVMRHAYASVGYARPPWYYRSERDFRTLASLAPDVPAVKPTVAHNALADAKAQALWMQRIMLKLGLAQGRLF